MPRTPSDKLTEHDFYTNSVQSLVEDDDIEQFLHDNPDEATKLTTALDALSVTYEQVKTAAEAASEDKEEEDEGEEDEDVE